MPQITEIQARSILTPQKMGALSGHFDYSLNPYAGCAFKCSYCYVPSFPSGKHEKSDWGEWVEVKVNAPELLRKDRLKIFGAKIFFSSATDPYQYLELKYRLTRKCLQELLRYQPSRVVMHTRSHLILQDIDLLKQFGDKLSVGVSITTNDDAIRKEFEPKAPSISRRLELIRTLSSNGIIVNASLAPLLPLEPDKLLDEIEPYVSRVWLDEMRYLDANNRKDLLEKYSDFFEPNNYRKVIAAIRARLSDDGIPVRSSGFTAKRR